MRFNTPLTVATMASTAATMCVNTHSAFQLAIEPLHSRTRAVAPTDVTCGSSDILTVTMRDGVITDALGRTGCIVANYQFQFDGPPQSGTIFQSGWSVCDGLLMLNNQTVFYQCPSGNPDGSTFYNLYDRPWAAHCEPRHLATLPCGYVGSRDLDAVNTTALIAAPIAAAWDPLDDKRIVAQGIDYIASSMAHVLRDLIDDLAEDRSIHNNLEELEDMYEFLYEEAAELVWLAEGQY